MTKNQIPARTALPVRPMNADQEPFDYPRALLASLSADAQRMYSLGQGRKLDRDVFDATRRRSHVPPDEAKAFQATERMLAAIAELEAARLATYDTTYGPVLRVTRVHERYTFAQGRGSQLIHVRVFDEHPDDARLLAVLLGGDLESRDTRSSMSEIAVRSRHENATDFEHDASSTAMLTVRNISQPVFAGYGLMSFTGVLTEANLYPIGVDPLNADDGETRPGDTCTRCEEHHPFAPFMPPKVDSLSGAHFVTVEVRPFRPYLVEAPPAFTHDTLSVLDSVEEDTPDKKGPQR
jgi:hypothetical protein